MSFLPASDFSSRSQELDDGRDARSCPSASAFTLVELLAVVAIVAVLALLISPAISRSMLSAKQAATVGALRNFGTAMSLYSAENNGALPGPAAVGIFATVRNPPLPGDRADLGHYLAPYMDVPADGRQRFCPGLANPTMPKNAQQNPNVAQFVKFDVIPKDDWLFGTWANNFSTAATAVPRPRKLASLSAQDRATAVITLADLETWNTSYAPAMAFLPPTGAFNGKRLWLFLDGSVSQPVTNTAAWVRQ